MTKKQLEKELRAAKTEIRLLKDRVRCAECEVWRRYPTIPDPYPVYPVAPVYPMWPIQPEPFTWTGIATDTFVFGDGKPS